MQALCNFWMAVFLLTVLCASSVTATRDDSMCGPRCLVAACQAIGVPQSLAYVSRLCRVSQDGTDFRHLSEACKVMGLESVGMKISSSELAGISVPAIARLWNRHFVLVQASSAGTLSVTDPPFPPEVISAQQFGKLYSGYALLVGRSDDKFPVPAPGGPDLHVAELVYDFGFVNEGALVHFNIGYKNAGSSELVISSVKPSCDCTVAIPSATTLKPGQEGSMNITIDTGGRIGYTSLVVVIVSNDSVTPEVQLQLVGGVKASRLALSARSIDFGCVDKGQRVSHMLYIPSSGKRDSDNYSDKDLKVSAATTDSPLLSVSLLPAEHKPYWAVRVSVSNKAPPGPISGVVKIISNHEREPIAEVMVTGMVRGTIRAEPKTLLLSGAKGARQKSASVIISTVGKDPFKITKIDNPLSCVSVDVKPSLDKLGVEGKEYVLTATLKPDAPLGNIKGEMVVHTNDPHQP